MTQQSIHQIYDKLIKKILTLSSTAIINLINGLFGTDHPVDSNITYNWTEFEDNNLKRTLADTIITINNVYSYHIEAQMTKDDSIVLRVFEYGFHHALRTASEVDGIYHIHFPSPVVIYLYYEGTAPANHTLEIYLDEQQHFEYRIPTLRLPDISTEELNQRKMVILIPFYLLKLRKIMEKERSEENQEALKNLLEHDILQSINDNLRAGNITVADAQQLKSYTHLLYNHLYSHYSEMERFNDMMDESIMTDADIIVKECEDRLNKALFEKDGVIAQKEELIAQKNDIIAQKEQLIEEKRHKIAEQDIKITEQDIKITEQDIKITEQDSKITEQDSKLAEQNSKLAEQDSKLAEKDKEILLLKQRLAEFEGTRL